MAIKARIEIRSKELKGKKHPIVREIKDFLHLDVTAAESIKYYCIQGLNKTPQQIEIGEIKKWGEVILSDSILEDCAVSEENDLYDELINNEKPAFVLEVSFRPGVTDNVGHSATDALKISSKIARQNDVTVFSGKITLLYGTINEQQARVIGEELLANNLLQKINVYTWNQFIESNRFSNTTFPDVHLNSKPVVEEIDLSKSNQELLEMSKQRCWSLSAAEVDHIKKYYNQDRVIKERAKLGLGKNPTDVELEVIAQSWSEHCKHKIFAANIDYQDQQVEDDGHIKKFGNFKVESLYKTYIKGITHKVIKDRGIDWTKSVFKDNAGIVRFDKNVDFSIKIETHNTPSALDPYGGSITGILGVNRDIMGVGLGAKPIANTDVFCFGPQDLSRELPNTLKHPKRILAGVHLGVEDGGNRSGIPTVNGAFVFDENYAGKPLVYVGTVGVMPHKVKQDGKEVDAYEKYSEIGDKVVMAGGRIGKDGIHGATFSSVELDKDSPVTAVQIGDPITQKRLLDFTLEARDLGLYSSITDNGAGGLSSSVGEMATQTGGAEVDLVLAPVKYPGLQPYELLISESQERMSYAVSDKNLEDFLELAKRRGVEACVLGEFNKSGYFTSLYAGKIVAHLELDFLHESLPKMDLTAVWQGPKVKSDGFAWKKADKSKKLDKEIFNDPKKFEKSLKEITKALLKAENVSSKEELVRRYDHEVQAATHIKPFVGTTGSGPSDAGVIWAYPHGGEKQNAITISCGINPKLSEYDAYVMSQNAVDEAVRNSVAVGADPTMICLVDNFCWPDPIKSQNNPDGDHKLAQLVRCCRGLYETAEVYGMPFVSGKDSMKNDFLGENKAGEKIKISVPPTLLVSAMGKANVEKTCTTDFKKTGDKIFIVGNTQKGLWGSEFSQHYNYKDQEFDYTPEFDSKKNFETYKNIHQCITSNLLASCHDISDGGALVSVIESIIGNNLGAQLALSNKNFKETLKQLINESSGSFVVSVCEENVEKFKNIIKNYIEIGEVTSSNLEIKNANQTILNMTNAEFKESWGI